VIIFGAVGVIIQQISAADICIIIGYDIVLLFLVDALKVEEKKKKEI
jgi:hypothetical protein